MTHNLLDFIRKPAAIAVALGLAFAPSASFAQWWGEEGLYENDYYAGGLYEDESWDDDDWFYDGIGENYGASYGGYNDAGLYEGEVEEEEEGLYSGYEDYAGYYDDGALEEEDDWF